MNQRDLELLDKELWGVGPNPRLERGALGVMVIVAFVGGLLMGGTLVCAQIREDANDVV
jgi:hypothetical protein